MNTTIQLVDLAIARPTDIVSRWASALQDDVQPVKLFRARNARLEPKGNALVTYTFTVSRGHDSVGAAETYLDDLPRLVRNVNRAVAPRRFVKQGGLGAPGVSLDQARATFQAEPANGIRTTVQWTVTGTLPEALT